MGADYSIGLRSPFLALNQNRAEGSRRIEDSHDEVLALFRRRPSSYHSPSFTLTKTKMRHSLPAMLLLSTLLAACATSRDGQRSQHIAQDGPLKVHPGLLGQPVPAELAPTPATTAPTPVAEAPIRMDQDGLRTQRSVYFDYNSADLKADYDPALRAHARYLLANPQARVRIEGNADERGSAGFNLRLGERRAATVRDTLIAHGAPGAQVKVKSLGESQPKLKGRDEASWAENRRADVIYEVEK